MNVASKMNSLWNNIGKQLIVQHMVNDTTFKLCGEIIDQRVKYGNVNLQFTVKTLDNALDYVTITPENCLIYHIVDCID